MSTTSKNKIMLIAVTILVLTNLGMVAFILKNKGGGKEKERGGREMVMRNFLQKDVGFSDGQMQQFDSLSKQNKEKIKADFDKVRSNKQELYKALGSSSFDDSSIQHVAKESAEMQELMEEKMLRHFKNIRNICTNEQLPKFDSLFWKIWNKPPERKKTD